MVEHCLVLLLTPISINCLVMHALRVKAFLLCRQQRGQASMFTAFLPYRQQRAIRARTQPRQNRKLASSTIACSYKTSRLRTVRVTVAATTAGGDAINRGEGASRQASHPPNSYKKVVGTGRRGWSYSDDPVKVKVSS